MEPIKHEYRPGRRLLSHQIGAHRGLAGAGEIASRLVRRKRALQRHGFTQSGDNQIDSLLIHRIKLLISTACNRNDRFTQTLRPTSHANGRLAARRLSVDAPLARNHHIDVAKRLIKAHKLENRINTRGKTRAECEQSGT